MKPTGEKIPDETGKDAEKPDSALEAQALTSIAKWMPVVDKVLITVGWRISVPVLHRRGDRFSAACLNVDKSQVIPAPGTTPANPVRFSQVINKG